MVKPRVLLIHWNAGEAARRLEQLRALGFDAQHAAPGGMPGIKAIAQNLPGLFVIDLERLPSQGRAVAVALRGLKATRQVPIVFAGGAEEKICKTREMFPDAVFAVWESIGPALRQPLQTAPAKPVVPGAMDAYAGAPLVQKLAIREHSTVALLSAPADFIDCLASLPQGVRFTTRAGASADLVLLFVESQRELARRFDAAVRGLSVAGAVWILWPKKTSGRESDLTQAAVRAFGLAAGFVDYKICSVDAVWSSLLFARRRAPKS